MLIIDISCKISAAEMCEYHGFEPFDVHSLECVLYTPSSTICNKHSKLESIVSAELG